MVGQVDAGGLADVFAAAAMGAAVSVDIDSEKRIAADKSEGCPDWAYRVAECTSVARCYPADDYNHCYREYSSRNRAVDPGGHLVASDTESTFTDMARDGVYKPLVDTKRIENCPYDQNSCDEGGEGYEQKYRADTAEGSGIMVVESLAAIAAGRHTAQTGADILKDSRRADGRAIYAPEDKRNDEPKNKDGH